MFTPELGDRLIGYSALFAFGVLVGLAQGGVQWLI
jgi:hypothetical protein